jgi:hypothetical protein
MRMITEVLPPGLPECDSPKQPVSHLLCQFGHGVADVDLPSNEVMLSPVQHGGIGQVGGDVFGSGIGA